MAKPKRKPAAKKKKTVAKVAKKKRVQAIPARYSSVIPCFRMKDSKGAIEFVQKVFGAKVIDRYDMPDGSVAHCEMKIGNVVLMCGDGQEGDKQTLSACIYVKDADATFQKALALGAKAVEEVQDKFYGDRSGRFLDTWGNEWVVSTHVEDVSKKEMQRRMAAMGQGQG